MPLINETGLLDSYKRVLFVGNAVWPAALSLCT